MSCSIRRYGLDKYDADVVAREQTDKSAEATKSVEVPGAIQKTDAAGAKQYVVQAGAFAYKGNARKRLREVRKLGGAFKKAFLKKHGMNYVVQTGVFDYEQYARGMAAELEKAGIEWCIKVR